MLAGASRVGAHPFLQNSWWVVVETNRLVMRVSATLREVAVVQRLSVETNRPVDLPTLTAALTNHGDYVLEALKVEADGKPLPGEVLDFRLVSDPGTEEAPDSPLYLDQTHAAFDLEFRFASNQPPREIVFAHATLRGQNYAPGIPWDVTYALLVKDGGRKDLAAGLVRMDLPFALSLPETLNSAPPTNAASLAPHGATVSTTTNVATEPGGPGKGTGTSDAVADPMGDFAVSARQQPFLAYLKLGIHHILTGWDHLLFLAALSLAAARLGDFFKLIAVFTAAHSITVTLSALNWVRLPPWFVEPFIAASIVFVALQNVLAPKQAAAKSRFAVAFGFGLVHGLGFAFGLKEALGGTGGTALAVAILAFCVGVELGHLFVGLPFWSVIRAGRAELGEQFGTRSLKWGSLLVAAGGGYFLVAALRNYV